MEHQASSMHTMDHIKRLLKNKIKNSVMDSSSQTIGVTSGCMSHDGRHAPPPDLDYQEVNHTLSGSFVRHHWSMPSNNWHRLISKPLEICAGRNLRLWQC